MRAALGLLVALATTAHADRLSPADLARKNDGGYVTALPLVSYSTDTGFGGGARAFYYWNGHPDDPRFAVTPYLYRVFVQLYATTRGVQFHWVDFDAPRIADSPYRIRAQFIYGRNTNSNYFGHGDSSLDALGSFDTYGAYHEAQEQVVNGTTLAKYDQYEILKPTGIATLERSFGHVRTLAGVGFMYAHIHDYT